ncbi:MAG: methyltransferase domain-containing protein [Opitutaceae bacterium]|nr:methyltransferase domain-containing protein [Opitutaceae bacterium]
MHSIEMQAAPPAPSEWFSAVSLCWCGGRSSGPSPCSDDYFVCERCGTHVARKRLRTAHVADFYSMDRYWHSRQQQKAHPTLNERREIFARDGRVALWLGAIERHARKDAPRSVVEIGCAEGSLLCSLREKGWQTTGVEPDPATASAVHEATGLDVVGGIWPGAKVPECDLFVACDVLEHALDPVEFLKSAAGVLRPQGTLFLQLPLVIPGEADFGHITPKVYDPWEHSFIFTRHSIEFLLAVTGFEVISNDQAWIRAHEFVVARKQLRPERGHRLLANLPEMFSLPWRSFMEELNAFARPLGLREFSTWSKIWEYPALWYGGLDRVAWPGARLIDIGSELSPLPWWLAMKGAEVTLVETNSNYIGHWEFVKRELKNPRVNWAVVSDSSLPAPSASVDVVTSLSVIEHQPDKARAISEVVRVLKQGGMFAMSFDIAEPALGMTYPEWNGCALTRSEFESLFRDSSLLQPLHPFEWNNEDMGPFLAWHRLTAPHHNYVTGAAVFQRTAKQPGPFQRLRHAYSRLKAGLAG